MAKSENRRVLGSPELLEALNSAEVQARDSRVAEADPPGFSLHKDRTLAALAEALESARLGKLASR